MSLVKTNNGALFPTGGLRSLLKERVNALSKAMLLDTSGSMSAFDGKERSRIEYLNELVGKFPSLRRFGFDSDCKESQAATFEASGGTNLGGALKHVKDAGVQHIVLITDGQPDSESYALQEAVGLKIDCIYVGPESNAYAQAFLRRLAESSGGTYGATSISFVAEIEAKVRLLLEAGK